MPIFNCFVVPTPVTKKDIRGMLHVDSGEQSPAPGSASDPIVCFSNSYARLPGCFFARVDPTPVASPRLIRFNHPLAQQLGLQQVLRTKRTGGDFRRQRYPTGVEPIALAYAGHQFGGFVPQLGDGRAILLGEVVDRDGVRSDIQLKGSGLTPFSRRGDGRAALGPVLREYLVSEAMHALGVPTTRALAVRASKPFVSPAARALACRRTKARTSTGSSSSWSGRRLAAAKASSAGRLRPFVTVRPCRSDGPASGPNKFSPGLR